MESDINSLKIRLTAIREFVRISVRENIIGLNSVVSTAKLI